QDLLVAKFLHNGRREVFRHAVEEEDEESAGTLALMFGDVEAIVVTRAKGCVEGGEDLRRLCGAADFRHVGLMDCLQPEEILQVIRAEDGETASDPLAD